MSSTMSHSIDESKLTFRDVVSIFFYTKRVFILTFIGVVIAAVLIAFLSSPKYEVAGRVLVKPRIEKPVIFEGADPRLNIGDQVTEKTLNTVVHLFSSHDVIQEVVRRHNLAEPGDEKELIEAVSNVRDRVKAEPLAQSDLVSVVYTAPTPDEARDHLNTLLDAYIAYHIRVNQGVKGSMEFFDQQAKIYGDKYVELSNELALARKRLNITNPTLQADAQLAVVRDLQTRRSELQASIAAKRQQLAHLQNAYKTVGNRQFAGLGAGVRQSFPALVEMERSIAQLIINTQRAESDFTADSKPVVDARRQLNNMIGQIRGYMSDIISGVGVDIESQLREAEALAKQIDDINSGVSQMSADDVIVQRIQFERDLAEENYRLYEQKREEARISEEKDRSQFANVVIASRPLTPTSPAFPNRPLILIASIPIGLLLALVASILAYSSDQTVRNPGDISSRTRLRVLGSLDAV